MEAPSTGFHSRTTPSVEVPAILTAFGFFGTIGAITTAFVSRFVTAPSSLANVHSAETVTIVLEATRSPSTSAVNANSSPVTGSPPSEQVQTAFVALSMRSPFESSAISVNTAEEPAETVALPWMATVLSVTGAFRLPGSKIE